MTKRLRAIAILACQTIFAVSLAACSGDTGGQANSYAVPVVLGEVQRVEEHETLFVSGTVYAPDSPSVVSFLVSGKVVFVGPREGEYVKKGQVLAQIDPTDFQLSLNIAQAQKDSAKAALEKTTVSVRPELLEQARVEYDRAEDEYRRMKMLYELNSLAENDFRKFKAAFETSKQQYQQAKMGGQKEDKQLYRAAYNQADANLQVAAKALSDATLQAPVSGYISKRSVEVGDTASAGKPVFDVVQLGTVEANVGVPETDIHLVKIGQKASITFPALPNQSFEGTVRIINVSADPGTRTYMTRISIPNPEHIIRIGMVAEAKLFGDRKISMATVPGEAIIRDEQGATMVFCYFPEQQRVYRKRVKVGAFRGTQVEIQEGLSGNESIVIAGQDYLRDGMPVTVASLPPENVSAGKGR
ncbi:MAG: efflux RND transporter periplasmic adaptor subunit [Desulfobacteraceae bacterium]|nr:MAG: efflux RND transporter periplasmic adaptor subunit [Desulfobacteraceae bacterium]